ncbi:MAG TPA: response regulator [Candidatus Limnocylindrales bacterium]|nr:response regulator [Candidatus Limnocylindrales bacterium]
MAEAVSARILIVDDEASQRSALCKTLRDYGYDTVGMASAREALALLDKERFDLLLTDLMMPETSGIDLLHEAMKKDEELIGIIMTGQGSIDSAVEAMKIGAFDYILKPFKLSVILPVLSRAMALRRLRLENAVLATKVQERTRALEEANAELEAFAYSVSHDLRAPLRHIHGFIGVLVKKHGEQLPDDARQLVDLVHSGAMRMGQLIEDLLRFSRLSRQPLSRRQVQLSSLVQDILSELRKETEGRSVEIVVGELADCTADTALLKQVFVNLISNALKYTRNTARPVIEIGCSHEAGETIYYVKDNGAGFDMAQADKLFGVFQRLHGENEFEGTGVGLSIVRRIVQRHGGRVWAEGSVGKGATFFLTLPEEATAA